MGWTRALSALLALSGLGIGEAASQNGANTYPNLPTVQEMGPAGGWTYPNLATLQEMFPADGWQPRRIDRDELVACHATIGAEGGPNGYEIVLVDGSRRGTLHFSFEGSEQELSYSTGPIVSNLGYESVSLTWRNGTRSSTRNIVDAAWMLSVALDELADPSRRSSASSFPAPPFAAAAQLIWPVDACAATPLNLEAWFPADGWRLLSAETGDPVMSCIAAFGALGDPFHGYHAEMQNGSLVGYLAYVRGDHEESVSYDLSPDGVLGATYAISWDGIGQGSSAGTSSGSLDGAAARLNSRGITVDADTDAVEAFRILANRQEHPSGVVIQFALGFEGCRRP